MVLALEGGYMGPGVGEAVVQCVGALLGETGRQVGVAQIFCSYLTLVQ